MKTEEKKTDEQNSEAGTMSEIDSMLQSLAGLTSSNKSVDDVKEDQEASQEDDERVDEKEESTEEEAKEEEVTEEEEVTAEPDEKDKIIADLQAKLDAKKEAEKEEVKEEVKEEPPQPLELASHDFIGEDDVESILYDKDKFNALLNKVYTQGVADARNVLGEHVLRDIPNIVRTNVSLMQELANSSEKFYKDNPDLVPFKKVVAAVFEEVSAANPGKDYSELLDEVGKEARGRLDLHKKASKSEDEPPRLPKKRGSRTSSDETPDISPIESEIGAMNKSIGR